MPEVRINLLHALENFLNMYKYSPATVLVIESISNALDAHAKNINIRLKEYNGEYYYIIEDDGIGMDKKNFDNYHTIALSSKRKGESIGFAGVGAKIYLAAWNNAKIFTQTHNGKEAYASVMYRYKNSIYYDYQNPNIRKRGTQYIVKLSYEHFRELESYLEEYIRDWFNEAIKAKTKIFVNGKELQPFIPNVQIEYKKGDEFYFFVSKDDLPKGREGLELVVFGKRIRLESIDWIYEVKEEYKNKIGGIIYLDKFAKYLTTSKDDFQDKKREVSKVIRRYRTELREWLHKNGILKNMEPFINELKNKMLMYDISDRITNIINKDKWKWLNPSLVGEKPELIPNINGNKEIGSIDGLQLKDDRGNGPEPPGQKPPEPRNSELEEGKEIIEKPDSGERGKEIRRTVRGKINISPIDMPDRPDEGWIIPEQNTIYYNIGHNLHKKLAETNNTQLITYNIIRVVIMTLIRYKQEEIDIKKAFDTITEFLTEVW